MGKQTLNTLRQYFKTGSKPTEVQFWDWLESFFHKDDKIPITSIDGLQQEFDKKVNTNGTDRLMTSTEASQLHSHDNKSIINDLNESNGTLTYKGNPIGSGGAAVDSSSVDNAIQTYAGATSVSDETKFPLFGKIYATILQLRAFLSNHFASKTHNHTKSEISDFPSLAAVATSGSYNDLNDKPEAQTVIVDAESVNTAFGSFTSSDPSDADEVVGAGKKKFSFSNIYTYLKAKFDAVYAAAAHSHAWSTITGKPTFSTVATSGSYNDLLNTPNLGALDEVVKVNNWDDPSRMSPDGDVMYSESKLWLRQNSEWFEIPFSYTFYVNADIAYENPDLNKIYRYTGSGLALFGDALVLGTTYNTAFRGDFGNAAYQHSQAVHAPAGAQVNVIEKIKLNGAEQTVNNKEVDLQLYSKTDIDTKINELKKLAYAGL